MKIETATREFLYNGVALKDPDPDQSVEQVREFYSAIYPEIVAAAIEGPTNQGARLVYEFRRAVGTKGATVTTADKARARLARADRDQVTAPKKRISDRTASALANTSDRPARPRNDRPLPLDPFALPLIA